MLDGSRDVPWGQADLLLPCVSDSRTQLRWSSLGNMHTPKTGILPTRENASIVVQTDSKKGTTPVCLSAAQRHWARWLQQGCPQPSTPLAWSALTTRQPPKSEKSFTVSFQVRVTPLYRLLPAKGVRGFGVQLQADKVKYMIFPWAHVPPSLSVSVTGSCPQGAFLAELIWNPGASSALIGGGRECAVERQAGPQVFTRKRKFRHTTPAGQLAPWNLVADPPATQNWLGWNSISFLIQELPCCGLRLVPLQTPSLEQPNHNGNPVVNLLFALPAGVKGPQARGPVPPQNQTTSQLPFIVTLLPKVMTERPYCVVVTRGSSRGSQPGANPNSFTHQLWDLGKLSTLLDSVSTSLKWEWQE